MALDMIGQKIEEGDYVAYPGRHGSRLWVNISKVIGIEIKTHSWGFNATNYDILKVVNTKSKTGKIAIIECLDRVIKLGPDAIESAKKNGVIVEE